MNLLDSKGRSIAGRGHYKPDTIKRLIDIAEKIPAGRVMEPSAISEKTGFTDRYVVVLLRETTLSQNVITVGARRYLVSQKTKKAYEKENR